MGAIAKINAKIAKLQNLKKIIILQNKADKTWNKAKNNPVFYDECEMLWPLDFIYLKKQNEDTNQKTKP